MPPSGIFRSKLLFPAGSFPGELFQCFPIEESSFTLPTCFQLPFDPPGSLLQPDILPDALPRSRSTGLTPSAPRWPSQHASGHTTACPTGLPQLFPAASRAARAISPAAWIRLLQPHRLSGVSCTSSASNLGWESSSATQPSRRAASCSPASLEDKPWHNVAAIRIQAHPSQLFQGKVVALPALSGSSPNCLPLEPSQAFSFHCLFPLGPLWGFMTDSRAGEG